jgi:serine/threonine protein kinase
MRALVDLYSNGRGRTRKGHEGKAAVGRARLQGGSIGDALVCPVGGRVCFNTSQRSYSRGPDMTGDAANPNSIFDRAIGIASADERAAYITLTCGGDGALRREVERLVEAHFSARQAPGEPTAIASAAGKAPPGVPRGTTHDVGVTVAGRYDLLEKIGEGGMGEVWLARQSEPVKRNVALKLIKFGANTKQVLDRFGAERQALALMDHPNIAKVLDGGVTDDGRPFFVMELVKGVPITEYCDARRLTPAQRLELFVPVCQAIQHAHQKGIIHRDIKPSNVLIARYDERPVPKVIDFGIAKAIGQPLNENTIHTAFGGIIGTPMYMSPEQATLNNLDIDTRSDVYSLGVLLYELLTGNPPFAQKELEKKGVLEVLRVVREEEPTKPSTKVSTDEALPTLSANRGTEPRKLTALLRSELDWVVLKALEKDRSRRYQTAGSLAADISRFLQGEPVLAHPPSSRYRVAKFLRRRKGLVAAATAVAAALLVGLTAFAWQARNTALERDAAVAARSETKKRADELQKVSDFQARMLSQVDPGAAGLQLTQDVKAKLAAALAKDGVPEADRAKRVDAFLAEWGRVNATDAARDLIDRTVLKPAVNAVGEQFADQPLVDATLRQVLANRYRELGLYEASHSLQERVLTSRRKLLGDDHRDTLDSMQAMGQLLLQMGKLKEAEQADRELLERRRRVLGDDHPDTLAAMGQIAEALQQQGNLPQAETLFLESLTKRRRVLGDDDPLTLSAVNDMGELLRQEGKYPEAETLLREAIEKRRRVLGEDHVATLQSIENLSTLLNQQTKRAEALKYMGEVLEKRRRILGEAHPETLNTLQSLATILSQTGQHDEAESRLREALAAERLALGADHLQTLNTLSNLAVELIEAGKLTEAESLCRDSLERHRRSAGPNHPDTLIATNIMGFVLLRQKKLAEAEPFARQAMEIARQTLGGDHPDSLIYLLNVGALLVDLDKRNEAEPFLRDCVDKAVRKLGREHMTTLSATLNLGTLLIHDGRFREALEVLTPAEDPARKSCTGANTRPLAALLMNIGKARTGLKEYPGAEAKLLEAQSLYVTSRGVTTKDTFTCTRAFVDLYTAREAAEPGKGYAAKAAEWERKMKPTPLAPAAKSPANEKR